MPTYSPHNSQLDPSEADQKSDPTSAFKVCPWSSPHSLYPSQSPPCEPSFQSPWDLLNRTHSFHIRTLGVLCPVPGTLPFRVSPVASFSIFKSKLICPSKSYPSALITLSIGYFSLYFSRSILTFLTLTLEHNVYSFHGYFICLYLPIFFPM